MQDNSNPERGACALEKDEPRAPLACYSWEKFILLQRINGLRLIKGARATPLDSEQREILIQLAHRSSDVNFGHIRRDLALGYDTLFSAVSYEAAQASGKSVAGEGARVAAIDSAEEEAGFNYLPFYHKLRDAIFVYFSCDENILVDDDWVEGHDAYGRPVYDNAVPVYTEKLDAIAEILTLCEEEEARYKRIRALRIVALLGYEWTALLKLEASGFCPLSLKALGRLNPYLEQGLSLEEACLRAGFQATLGAAQKP